VSRRGDVDGAKIRPFTLGNFFSYRVEQIGEKYRKKIVKACADVVIGSDGLLKRRDNHRLRAGPGGEENDRKRSSDNATAFRCSIEQKSSSARRLHYWQMDGGAIEFASVGVHDDMNIPE